MTAPSRPGSCSLLAAALLILIAGGGLFSTLVPIVRCPDCYSPEPLDIPVVFFPDSPDFGKPKPRAPIRCVRCNDTFRVSLLNRLFKNGWEGKPVSEATTRRFRKQNSRRALDLGGIRLGDSLTGNKVEAARSALLQTGAYLSVAIEVERNPQTPGTVRVLLSRRRESLIFRFTFHFS